MKPKKLLSALYAVGVGLAIASAPAAASVTWYSPITAFQDDNLDYVFDVGANNPGVLGVGDRLFSVFEFANSQGVLAGQGPTGFGSQELTGVADITIVAIVGGNYIFAPTNSAATAALGFGIGSGSLGAFAAGTAIAAYIDGSPDLNVINAACGNRAACAALAGLGLGDGSGLFLTAGFFGDPDEAWIAQAVGGGGTIATVQAGGSSTVFGLFNLALSIGLNNTGVQFGLQSCGAFCGLGGDGMIQMTGNGNILGGQFLNAQDWTARSDTDIQLVPVPEPGSLALFGIALAGLGALRRRLK